MQDRHPITKEDEQAQQVRRTTEATKAREPEQEENTGPKLIPLKKDGSDLWHEGVSYDDPDDPHWYTGISIDRELRNSKKAQDALKLIVHRVNLHDRLVSALDRAAPSLRQYNLGMPIKSDLIDEIKSLLAEAKAR